MAGIQITAALVFAVLFALVAALGFMVPRRAKAEHGELVEWGLGGRRFGAVITWFLLGGDLYTAYTFIAVPALVFGAGAIGFFAVPYSVFAYPLLFLVFPRLWSVSRAKGYVTAADFIRGRFGSATLALLIALTGIVATLPYIALQLVGIEVVIAALGIPGRFPLLIAFLIVAGYTYTGGLRASARIAIVKDVLIYATVIAAVIVIPIQLGGYAKIFASMPPSKLLLAGSSGNNLGAQAGYATLALGSALALFLYPHAMTGVLSSSSRGVIRRNAVVLPAYSIALGLIAILGYMAVAAHVSVIPAYAAGFKAFGPNYAVPALFLHAFPAWFVGIAFAAIGIGALVPAAIMAIACANLFTRNIWREYFAPDCTPERQAAVAKRTAFAVKLGALLCVLYLPQTYAINFQLLGGTWIIQTLPAILIGLYTRKLHPFALCIGWAAGMTAATAMELALHLKGSIYPLAIFGWTVPCYPAFAGLVLNLAVSAIFSPPFFFFRRKQTADETHAADYA